jgi:hypothetical protein
VRNHTTGVSLRGAALLGALLWTGAPAPVQAQLAQGTDVNTSQKTGDDTECAIAKNPTNPNQLFASCNTAGAGLYAARSTDGGVTWIYPDADKTLADGDAGQGPAACCDPTLAWDTFGNLFFTYLDANATAVVTLLSVDGGATFTTLASFAGSVDQPTVVVANTTGAGAPSPVAVWIVWNQSGQMVARGSQVTGLNAVVGFQPLQTIPNTVQCSFGDVAISPAGVVVQACQNPVGGQGPSTIRVNIDADGLGPGNFGATVTATTTNVGGFDFLPVQNARSIDAEAGLAYDNNPASPHVGRLYLVYTEETVNENHDMDIMVRFSDNNGANWSAPIRLNDDPAAPIRSQFLPKISVDDTTGNVGVCWHDARNSPGNNSMQVFCTVAGPAGATPTFLPNFLVSDGTSTSNGAGVEFGDYAGIDYLNGVVHPIWADTSNSTGDNPNGTANFEAFADRVTGGPSAPQIQVPTSIAFPTTCGGTAQQSASICNTGTGDLIVTGITSSNPQITVAAPTSGFPVTIAPGMCLPIQVAFTPTSTGPVTATLTVASNDPLRPNATIAVSGTAGSPTIATVIVDTGNFGALCPNPRAFRDLRITLNNSGTCPLTVTGITSSSADFQQPQVQNFPLSVEPGDHIEIPIRFQPTSAGAKSATVTIATNDPVTPSKTVTVTGTGLPDHVCNPPLFTAIDVGIGPTFGTGRTGNYTVNGGGRFLGSFGADRTFGLQAQGDYRYYPGRHEGQTDVGLLYRRDILQAGFGGSFKLANLRGEQSAGALSHATLTFDVLLPTVRFGIFGSKGLRQTDVVSSFETVGAPTMGGQPIFVRERLLHTIDQLGGTVQFELAPQWWLDGNVAWLHRHAPGAGDTAGGAIRVSRQLLPGVVGNVQLDFNESFVGPNTVGTLTFGITLGRWSKPRDYSNPVNPLGTYVPTVHYEIFERTR